MQILPDIYLLDGHAYGAHPNFYLIHTDEGNVVVDSGIGPDALERADRQIELWGLSLEKVDYLLLTHSHYDHMGNAAALRSRGAPGACRAGRRGGHRAG